jgi:hypothetical protein
MKITRNMKKKILNDFNNSLKYSIQAGFYKTKGHHLVMKDKDTSAGVQITHSSIVKHIKNEELTKESYSSSQIFNKKILLKELTDKAKIQYEPILSRKGSIVMYSHSCLLKSNKIIYTENNKHIVRPLNSEEINNINQKFSSININENDINNSFSITKIILKDVSFLQKILLEINNNNKTKSF